MKGASGFSEKRKIFGHLEFEMPVQYKVIQELVILVGLDFRKSLKENVYLVKYQNHL